MAEGSGTTLEPARAAIDSAIAAVTALPDEARRRDPQALERLEAVLGYARIVVDATEPLLVKNEWRDAIANGARAITEDPDDAINDRVYGDDLLEALSCLPANRGRDLEQAAKDAAVSYQRSIAQRVNTLESQFATAESALQGINASIDDAKTRLRDSAEEATASLEVRVSTLADNIGLQQTALDEQLTRHSQAFNQSQAEQTQAFTQAQAEQAKRFQSELDGASMRLSDLAATADGRVGSEVEKIEKVSEDVGLLASAIALKVTADRYGDEADSQAKIANGLRNAAIVITFIAVAAAVWAVERNADDTHSLIAKLAVSSAVGALATYVATQSSRHRRREARSRELQLQLAAFSPFIAPLEPDLQQLERVRMARRTFGVWDTAEAEHPDDEDDLGPTALGMVKDILLRSRKGDAPDT